MKKFEELLLKTGNPDLICAFVREYRDSLSKDFAQNFNLYCKRIQLQLGNVSLDSDIPDMQIEEFLYLYGGDMSSTLKTRICNWFDDAHIKIVRDLLQYSERDIARIYNLGEKSVRTLQKAVKNAGYQLKN